ncbi:MAG: efflux RND transporter periplasmic adaptor subunit, partial [Gammaproteobacteria bacterium]|nr:efflux RND transporter periplasmic adaptor subunit [Gammaproteobacteria bacterium]
LARDRQQLTVTDLERQLGELAIRSPVTGMVGTVAVAERQAVTDNTPIVTVVDMTAYEIEMVVPESYAEELAIGLPAIVEIGRNEYPGRVRAVSPEIDNGQVRGRIRFDDTAPDGLRQNQRVSIRLQFETRDDALVVRRGPFYDDGGGRVAYVVDGNRAYRRAIRTGAVSVDQVEIIDGVEAGERIVISSHEPFRNADTVLLTQ